MESTPTHKRSGMVTIVGRSNVGKSTLVNALVGQKMAIVTPKPQTTRDIISGIINDDRGQIVIMDTPGFFLDGSDMLSKALRSRVEYSIKDVDVILYVVDPTRSIGNEERRLVALLRETKTPIILVINKIDLDEDKRPYAPDYKDLFEDAVATIEISALNQKHLKTLVNEVFKQLPEAEPLYPADAQLRDERHYAAEVIREKIFHTLSDELPYGVTVVVDSIENKPTLVVIKARILTNTDRHKKMIIGTGARKLKEMGSSARKELEAYANKKVFLDIEVAVDPNWMADLM